MRIIISLTILLALAACGGGRSDGRSDTSARVAFASGPMYDACLAAGRKNASRALCGCIQAQANRDLSARDQARAATFFADPQRAQDTRQSDNSASEAFWKRYRAYANSAEQACRAAV